MIRRKFQMLFLVAIAGLFVLPISAQEMTEDWSVYLFNFNTQELLQVHADGSQDTLDLGVTEGARLSTFDLQFTPDGQQVGYCELEPTPGVYGGDATVTLRDLAIAEDLLEQVHGYVIGCRVSQFNPEQNQMAVGFVNYFPGDTTGDFDKPIWQLMIIDMETGDVIQELNAENAPEALADFNASPFLPDARSFANGEIIFTMIPWAVGGPPELPAFTWNLADNSVEPVANWGKSGFDRLDTTNEMIWVDFDDTLPFAQPMGPIGPFNTVMIQEDDAEPRTLYYNSEWFPANSVFVNNGTAIAVFEIQGFTSDMGDMMSPPSRWILLDRNGEMSEIATIESFSTLAAVPDGFVLMDVTLEGQSTMTLWDYSGGERQALWSESLGAPSIEWDIAWATPFIPEADLEPFPEF